MDLDPVLVPVIRAELSDSIAGRGSLSCGPATPTRDIPVTCAERSKATQALRNDPIRGPAQQAKLSEASQALSDVPIRDQAHGATQSKTLLATHADPVRGSAIKAKRDP